MASPARLVLTRSEILAYRRRVGALDERLAPGPDSLRRAAWAGLQDSMPRAALLSIHARVDGTLPTVLEDPSLVQLWGPRYSTYVVAEVDRAVFTIGRMSDDEKKRRVAEEMADRLEAVLDGKVMGDGEAGRALGINPNAFRYGAPTGRILIRWDGARQPEVWMVPAPETDPIEARLELARRYLHVFGPATAEGFAQWAGIKPPRGIAMFDTLVDSLTPVDTPVGEAWILSDDEPSFGMPPASPASARLLPSGDAFYLLQGRDRELLVPDADRRALLWTSRVWPGAILVGGDVAGTWRRAQAKLTLSPWRRLSRAERDAVAEEAESLPLPISGKMTVSWDDEG